MRRWVDLPGDGREGEAMLCDGPAFTVRGELTDAELDGLHSQAFGDDFGGVTPWGARLERHSLTWVTARIEGELVAFVNVLGDGGAHAIVMDTVVAPSRQGHGIGSRLMGAAADGARRLGCEWLHADYAPRLTGFYEEACGMRPTRAGLLRL